jgi:hypothetical protein
MSAPGSLSVVLPLSVVGLGTSQLDEFAVTQATVGSDIEDVRDAAAMTQFQRTGEAPSILANQFSEVAQGMMRGLVR